MSRPKDIRIIIREVETGIFDVLLRIGSRNFISLVTYKNREKVKLAAEEVKEQFVLSKEYRIEYNNKRYAEEIQYQG